MIMISKTRKCVNGEGDCAEAEVNVDHIGHGAHAVVRQVKCDGDGNCEHFVNSHGTADVIAIQDFVGGSDSGNNVIIRSGMIDSDQVRLACPEGDSSIQVDLDEADDTFLCPKHSVAMEKQQAGNVFIRKIHIDEQP